MTPELDHPPCFPSPPSITPLHAGEAKGGGGLVENLVPLSHGN